MSEIIPPMVEAVARAIYEVSIRWIQPNFPEGWKLQTFDELDDKERRLNLEYARAAILAMRKPNRKMLNAAQTAILSLDERPRMFLSVKRKHLIRYQAMIDAALKPPAADCRRTDERVTGTQPIVTSP